MRIGIDLGGTKTEVIVIDDAGVECLRRRVATPRGDYDATVATIAALARQAEAEIGATCTIGVGTPGAISTHTGRIKNANSVVLNDRPLKEDLERALGREVRMDNDANCFGVSEATDGAAAGARVVFGVILGTGVGGALVIDRQAWRGANAIAGEWGHNPLPPSRGTRTIDAAACAAECPGPTCYCGRSGCIETWLSGPGMAADHRRHGGAPAADAIAIAAAAAAGDRVAIATVDRYVDRLARGLAHVINLLDPEVIVLGGGLSGIDALYSGVPQRWQQYVFSDVVSTRLVRNRHGDSSGVRGAAWLWPALRNPSLSTPARPQGPGVPPAASGA